MYRILKSIYQNVKPCVSCDDAVTDLFDCPINIIQGCVLSLILFSFFINKLFNGIALFGTNGFQLILDITELLMLLFTDDVILMSGTRSGLHNQFNKYYK